MGKDRYAIRNMDVIHFNSKSMPFSRQLNFQNYSFHYVWTSKILISWSALVRVYTLGLGHKIQYFLGLFI
jgi:hypothetical protein